MSQAKRRISKVVSFPLLITFFIVSALAVGFFTGIKIYPNYIMIKNLQKQTLSNLQATRARQSNPCQLYGIAEKEQYLDVYIVKSGDTLLSLSKTQLGGPSRVNEIITLNNDKYPTLSLNNPYIEVGWRLLLPPQRYGITNGRIEIIHGNFFRLVEYWAVYTNEAHKYDVRSFPIEDLEKYSHLNLRDGDCITVVFQDSMFTHPPIKALEIFKQ